MNKEKPEAQTLALDVASRILRERDAARQQLSEALAEIARLEQEKALADKDALYELGERRKAERERDEAPEKAIEALRLYYAKEAEGAFAAIRAALAADKGEK